MKRILFALAGGLLVLAVVGRGYAGPRIEADPNQKYEVTPEAGPWMICAASFTGPMAPQLAQELAVEIRAHFNLPAFVFNKGEKEREEQRQRVERVRQLMAGTTPHIPGVRIPEQCAVLVGGYKDVDAASKALVEVKKLKPSQEKFMPLVTVVGPAENGQGAQVKAAPLNPFAASFVVRNPTVSADKPKGPDPFLKQLNANEDYSLLKCGKPWTLAVKEYQGAAVIQTQATSSSFFEKLGFGSKSRDFLNATAQQAHELARLLRELKFDAYVLHGRNGSVVSVGAFDSPDDLRLQQLQRQLATLKFQGADLKLFAQPLPMQVPQF